MGIQVYPPDINESTFTFKPDVETGKILYGIKGITRINDSVAYAIIKNRPYTSLEDLCSKVKLTKLQIVNLLKSGALDNIITSREEALYNYMESIAGCKSRLTLQNMPTLIKLDLIPEEYGKEKFIFNFNKYLKKYCKKDDYYILDEYSLNFFNKYFDTDYLNSIDNEICIDCKIWDKMYKKSMDNIRPFLNSRDALNLLNNKLVEDVVQKYCLGNRAKWEMESIGFYNGKHELDYCNFGERNIVNFFSLPENPIIDYSFQSKEGQTINMYKLYDIAGTVLERDKLKNIVTLLTQYGVVKVKVYKPQFVKYDKQLFVKDEETGKKTVTEKSWFSRGNKLIISGIRRDGNFVPKVYKNSGKKPFTLIQHINYETGEIITTSERED